MNTFRSFFAGKVQHAGSVLFFACILLAASAFGQQANRYVGSAKSDRYHYETCRYVKQIKPENFVFFESVKEALGKRYVPCKVCRPPLTDE